MNGSMIAEWVAELFDSVTQPSRPRNWRMLVLVVGFLVCGALVAAAHQVLFQGGF